VTRRNDRPESARSADTSSSLGICARDGGRSCSAKSQSQLVDDWSIYQFAWVARESDQRSKEGASMRKAANCHPFRVEYLENSQQFDDLECSSLVVAALSALARLAPLTSSEPPPRGVRSGFIHAHAPAGSSDKPNLPFIHNVSRPLGTAALIIRRRHANSR
jgi:hypothetical protein